MCGFPLEALCSLRPQFFMPSSLPVQLPKPPQPRTKRKPPKLWIEPEVFLRRALEQEGNRDHISAKIREEKVMLGPLFQSRPHTSLGRGLLRLR